MIIPILLCGSEIWEPYLFTKINNFQTFKNIFLVINEIHGIHLNFSKRILES